MAIVGTITPEQISALAALMVATLVGAQVGRQTVALTGVLVLAIVAPANLLLLSAVWVVFVVVVKFATAWIDWLK